MEKTAKVLLIDDDKDFVSATKTILESKNYDVLTAFQGEKGLEMASQEKPDLIILDIIMPARDGFSVAEQLKADERLKKIPVIMLSAFSHKVSKTSIPVSRGLDLETEDYLEKPVSPEELLNTVAKYLK